MSFDNTYGAVDKLLHRLAFATGHAQIGAADLESKLFRRELEPIELVDPVFVTALPRAGTTILLEILARTPTFATHTYRDMPFVLTPMLWNKFSAPFRKPGEPRERAHADGIQISLDSPEAFEEVVWKAFWPDRYRAASIEPWADCSNGEFAEFLASHMQKVVALRARDEPTVSRYASKNNLNIARIPALWDAVPDAIVVVPFRDPLQHAASLLRQHQRFTKLHAEDRFASRYMAGIGHFDFGEHLKPVDFGGWLADRRDLDTMCLAFWVEYWRAVYRHVLQHAGAERLHVVGFEVLGAAPDLGPLATRLGVQPRELRDRAHVLKPAKRHEVDTAGIASDLLEETAAMYAELQSICVVGRVT